MYRAFSHVLFASPAYVANCMSCSRVYCLCLALLCLETNFDDVLSARSTSATFASRILHGLVPSILPKSPRAPLGPILAGHHVELRAFMPVFIEVTPTE